ncbi:MAG TPA: hypothetical protein VL307_10310 [Chitinophagaceae bacterium]|nr:hypothetical protein [Chitinophagaceae bacterium]
MSLNDIHICCPACHWEPDGKPYWQCSCGTSWNTFATAARCPGCGKVWERTQCVEHAGGCNAYSLHEDWYRGLDTIVEDLKVAITDGAILSTTGEG